MDSLDKLLSTDNSELDLNQLQVILGRLQREVKASPRPAFKQKSFA